MISSGNSYSEFHAEGTEFFVIYDSSVSWIAEQILASLGSGVRGAIAIDASEAGKSMDTVLLLCRSMMESGLSRGALVLCIGGGITSDIGGFAASIYKRGVRYANIPTTLLAQVDAGIGGKNGVNFLGYKNMVGTIVQPEFTYICAEALKTLPRREFLCGAAEMLKTFLIADSALYRRAVEVLSASNGAISPELQELIIKAAQIKSDIVKEDPFEHGRRAVLNLGHTFAHAIEHLAAEKGDDIAHGEAVAMGIVMAARLSEAIFAPGSKCFGGQKKAVRNTSPLRNSLAEDFASIGLPTECHYPLDELAPAMAKDKKSTGEKVKFVLLQAPGKPFFKELTPQEAIQLLK